jgi:molybdopterin/thiamine biosynthesis adenylyltransferase/proteasome lid subunit RPN8/RPN11
MATLALREEQWNELLATVDLADETGGFLLAGWDDANDELTLTGRSLGWVAEEHYVERTPHSLVIASAGYFPFLGAAANDQAVPVFVHTHPHMGAGPSSRDRRVDEALRDLALARSRAPYYVSLIVGGDSAHPTFTGRIFDESGQIAEVERLRVVGETIRLLHREGAPDADLDSEFLDRQIRAFGELGQRLLARLRVGVVGAGGTGSATFEQLVRAGFKEITVIDDDAISGTNLTRIHESGRDDVDRAKVEVMEQAAARIGLGTNVRAIRGKITYPEVAGELHHLDVIFGCTDDESGRNILAKLAITHLIPVFDMAFVVDPGEAGSVRGLHGRVTTLMPGAACLICRERLDMQSLLAEALSEEERKRRAKDGYVPGLGDPDPAVGSFTTMVSMWAINELFDRLFGYSADSQYAGATEALFLLHERMIRFNSRLPVEGHWCADQLNFGRAGQADL